jgi:hypothetical protein
VSSSSEQAFSNRKATAAMGARVEYRVNIGKQSKLKV